MRNSILSGVFFIVLFAGAYYLEKPRGDPGPAPVAVKFVRCIGDGRPSLALDLLKSGSQSSMQEYFITDLAAQWIVDHGGLKRVSVQGVDEQGTHARVVLNLDFSRGSQGFAVPLVKENGQWRVIPPI